MSSWLLCAWLYGTGFFCYTLIVTTSDATKLALASMRKSRHLWIYAILALASLAWPLVMPVTTLRRVLLQRKQTLDALADADLPGDSRGRPGG